MFKKLKKLFNQLRPVCKNRPELIFYCIKISTRFVQLALKICTNHGINEKNPLQVFTKA